jgi:hypothetical protein
MPKIMTPYGHIEYFHLDDFLRIAGYKIVNGQWVQLRDELEAWCIVNSASMSDSHKWKRQKTKLPFRDLNFQYAIAKTRIIYEENGKKKQRNDVTKAMHYAREKLLDYSGKPIYLPGLLAKENAKIAGGYYDPDTRPKLYTAILKDAEEESKNQVES